LRELYAELSFVPAKEMALTECQSDFLQNKYPNLRLDSDGRKKLTKPEKSLSAKGKEE